MASKRQLAEGNENLEPSTKQFKPQAAQDSFQQESDEFFEKFLESTKMKPSDFKDSSFQRFIQHLNKDSVLPTIVKNAVQSEDDPKKKYNYLQLLKFQQPQKDFIIYCLLEDVKRSVGRVLTDTSYIGIPNIVVEKPTEEELEAENNKAPPPKKHWLREIVERINEKQEAADRLLPKEVVFKQHADKLFRFFVNSTLMKASAFDNKEFQDYIQHLNSNAELPSVTKIPIQDENNPEKRYNDLLEWRADQDKKDEIQEHLRAEISNNAMRIFKERQYWSDVASKEWRAKIAKQTIAEIETAVSKIAKSE